MTLTWEQIVISCIQSVSYAEPNFGNDSNKVRNSADYLGEALCSDAESQNKKIKRSTYLEIIENNMDKLNMNYENAKSFALLTLEYAAQKCPDRFSR